MRPPDDQDWSSSSEADPESAGGAGTSDLDDVTLRLFELRHRTKNILTIVQSLVNQTLRGDVGIDEARRALSDRLVAMGRAVDMLMGNGWQPAPLEEVLKGGLVHHSRYPGRILLEGPALAIEAGAAMSLSLALHELESNAIKYGALSSEGGSVRVGWGVSGGEGDGRLVLTWKEAGGPPVTEPERRGFGSRLLSMAIGRRLGGSALIEYVPDGLCWTLSAPLRDLTRETAA